MISEDDVDTILNQHYKVLDEYCYFLGQKYNETLEGYYRIKFNDLSSFLHSPVSNKKKVELFNKLNIKFVNGVLQF